MRVSPRAAHYVWLGLRSGPSLWDSGSELLIVLAALGTEIDRPFVSGCRLVAPRAHAGALLHLKPLIVLQPTDYRLAATARLPIPILSLPGRSGTRRRRRSCNKTYSDSRAVIFVALTAQGNVPMSGQKHG